MAVLKFVDVTLTSFKPKVVLLSELSDILIERVEVWTGTVTEPRFGIETMVSLALTVISVAGTVAVPSFT